MSDTTTQLYEKLKHTRVGNPACTFTRERCAQLAPIVDEINALKKEKNALILAHSYLSPDILFGVADYSGDSYGLSLKAQQASQDIIVFAAVDFMAETAKILNPQKTVLAPNTNGGCSLAESIDATQVRALRAQHPQYTFVCYINTTAEVKAECDVTVTSSNVYGIIDALPSNDIFFLPDKLMAQNIVDHLKKSGSTKNLKWSEGTCYVHEQYDGSTIPLLRSQFKDLKILAHPECKPEVVQRADYVGSTSGMLQHVAQTSHDHYFLLTECGLTSKLQADFPEKKFVGTCMMCRYMKSATLEDILRVLKAPQPRDTVTIDPDVQKRALQCVQKMFYYAEKSIF